MELLKTEYTQSNLSFEKEGTTLAAILGFLDVDGPFGGLWEGLLVVFLAHVAIFGVFKHRREVE